MIIGTITFITMLFFGGIQEYFFVDELENGVKQLVIEKERSKEILADIKASKNTINEFDKNRKSLLKEFYRLNLNRNTTLTMLKDFFKSRMEERLIFQDEFLKERMKIISKIHDNEWGKIIALFDENVEKKASNEAKVKQQEAFENLINAINRSISENDRMVQALALVRNFQTRYNELEARINSINTRENDLLRNKSTTQSQFKALAKKVNDIRATSYKALVDFHFDMKEVAEETEWVSIMKAMNKAI